MKWMSINYAIAISIIFASLLSIVLSFRYFLHYYRLAMDRSIRLEENKNRYWVSARILVGSCLVLIASLGYMIMNTNGGSEFRAASTPTTAAPTAPTMQQTASGTTLSSGTTTPEQIPTQPATPVSIFAKVGNTSGAGVNVRSDPGLGATIIAQISDDSRVTLLEDSQEVDGFTWQLVVLPDGRRGWIAINFLIPEE
jgi:hypothetical protein